LNRHWRESKREEERLRKWKENENQRQRWIGTRSNQGGFRP